MIHAFSLAICLFLIPSQSDQNAAGQSATPWTFLIYGAVDNDWEQPFMKDIKKMRKGLAGVRDVEVILLIDRSPEYSKNKKALGEDFEDTRIYRLTGGDAVRISGEPEMAGVTESSSMELNTGAPETLRDFIRFGKSHYPADHYALVVVSHGEGMCFAPDETSDDSYIFTAQVTDTLTEEDSVDLLGFDACLMGGIENAYQWRKRDGDFGADVLVAAPPVSSSWPYRDIFARMSADAPAKGKGSGDDLPRPQLKPADLDATGMGSLMVEELKYQIAEGRSGDEGEEKDLQCWASYDCSKSEAAKTELDLLARLLFEEEEKADLLALRGVGLEADTYIYVWPEGGADASMPFVDLVHFCERISQSGDFSDEVRAQAKRSAEAATAVVLDSFGFDHYEGFQSGSHGIYLVFPDGDKKTRRGKSYWNEAAWYTPLAAAGDDEHYGRYAFCADGSVAGNGKVDTWFELMDAWFDEADENGGSNRYSW